MTKGLVAAAATEARWPKLGTKPADRVADAGDSYPVALLLPGDCRSPVKHRAKQCGART